MTFNQFDYDGGGGPKYSRASPAFLAYLGSDKYREYIRRLYLFQADPLNNSCPVFPEPPALDPGKGRQFEAGLGIQYKPLDKLQLSLDYNKSKLVRNETGRSVLDSNIFVLRSTYQFTRFVYLRARLNYESLNANLSSHILFGWTPAREPRFMSDTTTILITTVTAPSPANLSLDFAATAGRFLFARRTCFARVSDWPPTSFRLAALIMRLSNIA